jgi:Lon protease-like protein
MGYFNLPTLYLFDNVFFPNTIVPLNIFDAPSKNLIMHCYEHNEPLALWFQGEHVKPIASMGKILSVEKKDDGNLKVLLQGIGRVNLEKIIQHIPYPIYRAKFFQDAEAPPLSKSRSP